MEDTREAVRQEDPLAGDTHWLIKKMHAQIARDEQERFKQFMAEYR